MSKHGIIPTDEELAGLLQNLSQEYYNGHYMPGRALYDQHRPRRWKTGAAVCRAYRVGATPEGWRRLVCHQLGLEKPVAHRGVTWDPQIQHYRTEKRWQTDPGRAPETESELDSPMALCAHFVSEIPDRAAKSRGSPCGSTLRHWDSMDAIMRLRPVRAWCLRTKRYVTIGHQISYELR
jgi:hypothetical protein